MSEENLSKLQNLTVADASEQSPEESAKTKVAVSAKLNEKSLPIFEQEAETVPKELENEVADLKRDSQSEDSLYWATGEEVATYLRKGQETKVVKMRLEGGNVQNVPIYIFEKEAGSNFARLENLIGNRIKVGINTLEEVESTAENPKYVLIGSINQAEYLIGRQLFEEFRSDAKVASEKERVGTVTQIIETGNFSLISFNYEGMELGMLGRNWVYRKAGDKLTDLAYIGQTFKFKISSVVQSSYEEMEKEEDSGHPHPKGIFYRVMTTRLPFFPSPDSTVEKLYERDAQFEARIVRYHPVKGILVEIAPNWWIKGILSNNAPYQPTERDAIEHTPVVVHIESLDKKKHNGRARILRFPKGVARNLNNILHP